MIKVNLTCISATPYEQINLPGMECIKHYLDPGYCGPSRYVIGDDREIVFEESPGVPASTTQPDIHSYESFFGVGDLNVPSYESAEKFLMKQEGRKKKEAEAELSHPKLGRAAERRWFQYRGCFERDMASIIKSLLLSREILGVPYDKSDGNKTLGMLLRYPKSNVATRAIMNKIRDLLGDDSKEILFLEYFGRPRSTGRSRKMDTLKNFIAEKNPEGTPYVVWVTAAARMGVAFPRHTHYYFDLTSSPTTATSALQGSAGRATGYWKKPAIFLSRKFAAAMNDFYETGRWSGKFHMRTAMSVVGRPCKNGTVVVNKYRNNPVIMEAIAVIQGILYRQFEKYWEVHQENRGLWVDAEGVLRDSKHEEVDRTIKGRGKTDPRDIWTILNPMLDEIEKYPELVMHGISDGYFSDLQFVRFEQDKKKRKKLVDGTGCSPFIAEYDDKEGKPERLALADMISRRISIRGILDSKSQTMRDHDESPTQYGKRKHAVHASVFFVLKPTRKRCPRLVITKFQFPFRFERQKMSMGLVGGDRSMYQQPKKNRGLN